MFNIYLITNTINQKYYVGITRKTLAVRWKHHLQTAATKKKRYAIHEAIRKYGSDAFIITLIETTDDPSRECYWIKKYNSLEEGYNLTAGGDGTVQHKWSEEQRQQISDRTKILHEEKRVGMYGKNHSDESREKIRQSHISLNRTGLNNPMFGKKHSAESIAKMRANRKRK